MLLPLSFHDADAEMRVNKIMVFSEKRKKLSLILMGYLKMSDRGTSPLFECGKSRKSDRQLAVIY